MSLNINGVVTLKQNQAAQILHSVRHPVITLQNNLNTEAQVEITSGSEVYSVALPAGQPVLWPYSRDFSGNAILIKNSSLIPSQLQVGYFSFAGKATYPLLPNSHPIILAQYESTVGITKARLAQLNIKCPEPALLALLVGGSAVKFLAINTSATPPQTIYQHIAAQLDYIIDDHYQLAQNWWGKALAVINVSPITSVCQIHYSVG
jgi:hypothetical protein